MVLHEQSVAVPGIVTSCNLVHISTEVAPITLKVGTDVLRNWFINLRLNLCACSKRSKSVAVILFYSSAPYKPFGKTTAM